MPSAQCCLLVYLALRYNDESRLAHESKLQQQKSLVHFHSFVFFAFSYINTNSNSDNRMKNQSWSTNSTATNFWAFCPFVALSCGNAKQNHSHHFFAGIYCFWFCWRLILSFIHFLLRFLFLVHLILLLLFWSYLSFISLCFFLLRFLVLVSVCFYYFLDLSSSPLDSFLRSNPYLQCAGGTARAPGRPGGAPAPAAAHHRRSARRRTAHRRRERLGT